MKKTCRADISWDLAKAFLKKLGYTIEMSEDVLDAFTVEMEEGSDNPQFLTVERLSNWEEITGNRVSMGHETSHENFFRDIVNTVIYTEADINNRPEGATESKIEMTRSYEIWKDITEKEFEDPILSNNDVQRRRLIIAEALRETLPQNKFYGTPKIESKSGKVEIEVMTGQDTKLKITSEDFNHPTPMLNSLYDIENISGVMKGEERGIGKIVTGNGFEEIYKAINNQLKKTQKEMANKASNSNTRKI